VVILLVVLEVVMGVGGALSGALLLADPENGLGMATEILQGSPFGDFAIPGIILFLAIGVRAVAARPARSGQPLSQPGQHPPVYQRRALQGGVTALGEQPEVGFITERCGQVQGVLEGDSFIAPGMGDQYGVPHHLGVIRQPMVTVELDERLVVQPGLQPIVGASGPLMLPLHGPQQDLFVGGAQHGHSGEVRIDGCPDTVVATHAGSAIADAVGIDQRVGAQQVDRGQDVAFQGTVRQSSAVPVASEVNAQVGKARVTGVKTEAAMACATTACAMCHEEAGQTRGAGVGVCRQKKGSSQKWGPARVVRPAAGGVPVRCQAEKA